MNKKNENEKKVQSVVIVVLAFLLVVLVVGVTYAMFTYSKEGGVVNKIETATMTMNYIEGDKGIVISNAVPTPDDTARLRTGVDTNGNNYSYDFTIDITMTPGQGLIYQLTAVKYTPTAAGTPSDWVPDTDIRLYLESSPDNSSWSSVMEPAAWNALAADTSIGAKSGEMLLATVGVTASTETHYRLRMWVNTSYELDGTPRMFAVKVNAYGKDATPDEVAALNTPAAP